MNGSTASDSNKLVRLRRRDDTDTYAFGKTYAELEYLFQKITTDVYIPSKNQTKPFLTSKEINSIHTTALPTLLQRVNDNNRALGFKWGPLGESVNHCVETIRTYIADSESPPGPKTDYELVLDALAHIEPKVRHGKKKTKQEQDEEQERLQQERRQRITNALLALASLCSGHRDCTKCLVIFMLERVFGMEKSVGFYWSLLQNMGIDAAKFIGIANMDRFEAQDEAKQLIIAQIIGNSTMSSVVELCGVRMLATFRRPNANSINPRIFPPSARALAAHFATDNFFDEENEDNKGSIKQITEFFVKTMWYGSIVNKSLVYTEEGLKIHRQTKDGECELMDFVSQTDSEDEERIGGSSSISEKDASISEKDEHPDAVSRPNKEAWQKLKSFTYDLINELSNYKPPEDIAAFRARSDSLFCQCLAGPMPPAGTVVTQPSSSVDEKARRGDSPLTVDGELGVAPKFDGTLYELGAAVNGLTITEEGIAHCICQYHATVKERAENATDTQIKNHARNLYNKLEKTLKQPGFEKWAKAIKEGSELDTDLSATDLYRALTGSLWTIEQFEILKIMGGGNFGRVALVRAVEDLRMRGALKIESFTPEQFRKWGTREFCDGSKVRHENIARTLAYFLVPAVLHDSKILTFGLLQEECGANLKGVAKRIEADTSVTRPEKVKFYCHIGLQVLRAVMALNDNRINHRDIKLENICEGLDGLFKLVDFGLSREMNDDGSVSVGVGTAEYIPSENSGGPKHNVYSLGIVLYHLLAGGFPVWVPTTHYISLDDMERRDQAKASFKLAGVAQGTADGIVDTVLAMTAYSEHDRLDASAAYDRIESLIFALPEPKE